MTAFCSGWAQEVSQYFTYGRQETGTSTPLFQHPSPSAALYYPIACLQLDTTVPYAVHSCEETWMVILPKQYQGDLTSTGQPFPGMA